MAQHIVTSFDEDLEHLDRLIRDMGDLAAAMTKAATRALLHADNALAQRVVSNDVVMMPGKRSLTKAP